MGEQEPSLNILMSEGEKVQTRMILPDLLTAPVHEGMAIGRMDYLLGDMVIRSFPVYTASEVEEVTWSWCAKKIIFRYIY